MLKDTIEQLTATIQAANPTNAKDVELYRQQYLGRNGEIQKLFEEFKSVSPEEKKTLGKVLNELKRNIPFLEDAERGLAFAAFRIMVNCNHTRCIECCAAPVAGRCII